MRWMSRRSMAATRRRYASSRRATISSPDVSLSSRWTMPGRSSWPPRAPSATSPCASVPCSWPGAGCTTTPGRLVDHEQPVVLVDDLVGHGLRRQRRLGRRRRPARATSSPARRTCRLRAGAPPTSHEASSIRRWADGAAEAGARREHDVEPRAGLRRGRRRNERGLRLPGAKDHLRHEEHGPDDDRRVGHVEGRPAVEADEVDDRPVEAQPVDEIAEGAAEDDAQRQPVARRQPGRARRRRPPPRRRRGRRRCVRRRRSG